MKAQRRTRRALWAATTAARGGALQRKLLDLLPSELLATEVSVAGGGLEDGLVEAEVADDATGAEVKVLLHELDEGLLVILGGAVSVDVDGERVGDTNGVGELDADTVAEVVGHEGLGDPAGGVGGGTVDLGAVLAGEGTASVGAPTSVGVDDDLSAGEAGVTVGSADDEAAGGVDVVDGLLIEVLGGDDGLDDVLHDVLVNLLVGDVGLVLGGDDDGVDADGDHAAVLLLVLDGDLGLTIGAQPLEGSILANVGETLAEAGGEEVGEGHELGGLIGGVAEHDALVTSADLLDALVEVDALGDIGALLLDGDDDVAGVAVDALVGGGVADVADGGADDVLEIDLGVGGDLTEDHDHAGLGGGLAGDLGLGVLGEAGVEDGIGNLIAELV